MSKYDCWEVAEAVISVTPRVLLRGKPGTGKTYHAVHAGLRDDQKVYTVTMTEETPAAELRGHYVPKGDEFIWTDGPAIRAWREGARLVINEIDRSSEDVLSLMYAILDDPDFAELTLPTGEKVRPKEGFQVVATMNGIPEDLPDALQDRLPVDIEITDVNPNALARLPEDLQEPARNTALAKSQERGISIRMWLEFASLREKLPEKMDDREEALTIAAQAIFGERAQDALNALAIAENASAPISMHGTEVDESIKLFAQLVHEWDLAINPGGSWEGDWNTAQIRTNEYLEGQGNLKETFHAVKYDVSSKQLVVHRTDGTLITATHLAEQCGVPLKDRA